MTAGKFQINGGRRPPLQEVWNSLSARRLVFGVPPLGGFRVLPPEGGTPNRGSKHLLSCSGGL